MSLCVFVNYAISIHILYGLSLQSGECFGCAGNSRERLRDKLVSLGLGRKHGGVTIESDDLIACPQDSDNVGKLTSDFSSSCDFSS